MLVSGSCQKEFHIIKTKSSENNIKTVAIIAIARHEMWHAFLCNNYENNHWLRIDLLEKNEIILKLKHHHSTFPMQHYTDSLDQCPMQINDDQNPGIDPKYLSMLINSDHLRGTDRY